jgi:hypothetical protein
MPRCSFLRKLRSGSPWHRRWYLIWVWARVYILDYFMNPSRVVDPIRAVGTRFCVII